MASEIFGEEEGNTRNFVRWYDPDRREYQEETVEILLEGTKRATIWCVNGLQQETPVYINADSYSGNGIVSCSKPEQKGYRVIIRLDCENMLSPFSSQFDPGILAVEGFLTDEEEAKILESLGDELEPETELDETPSDAFGLADLLKSPLASAARLAKEDSGRLH